MTPRSLGSAIGDAAIRAVETNVWAMHADFRRVPAAVVHDAPDLLWFTVPTTSSWLNGASRTRLSGGSADAAIGMVVDELHALGRNVKWHVGPSTQPTDLTKHLAARGFTAEAMPGMARSLDGWSRPAMPPELDIRVVAVESDLLNWLAVFDAAFGGDGPSGREHPWFGAFRHLTLGTESPCRLFIGRVGAEYVACSLAFHGGGAVGVYGVGTPPPLRGRGYGSALTVAAIKWGRLRGARLAILHASEFGEPVYRRLGFDTVCEVSQWLLPAPAT